MAPAFGMRKLDTTLAAGLDSAPILANQPTPPFLAEACRTEDDCQSGANLPRSKGSADPIYGGFQSGATDQCGGGQLYIRQLKQPEPLGEVVNGALSIPSDERVACGSDVIQKRGAYYPDVIHSGAGGAPERSEQFALYSDYRRAAKREERVAKPIGPSAAQDRRAVSYDATTDRWPALFEASEDDYFDDAMVAWRELSHRRRLAREQAGSLWNE
jgi:hypothetical protein